MFDLDRWLIITCMGHCGWMNQVGDTGFLEVVAPGTSGDRARFAVLDTIVINDGGVAVLVEATATLASTTASLSATVTPRIGHTNNSSLVDALSSLQVRVVICACVCCMCPWLQLSLDFSRGFIFADDCRPECLSWPLSTKSSDTTLPYITRPLTCCMQLSVLFWVHM